jgi:hypothetical protein
VLIAQLKKLSPQLSMICKLCTLDKTLVDSHIITDSCYAEIYKKFDSSRRNLKPKHRAYKVTRDEELQRGWKKVPIQTGFKEYLLCEDCERILNDRYEKYFNRNWLVNKNCLKLSAKNLG